MKNNNHNLIQQLSEDLDSLWRYKQYLKDSKGCKNCQKIWKQCQILDEEKIKLLQSEIAKHVKGGIFQ